MVFVHVYGDFKPATGYLLRLWIGLEATSQLKLVDAIEVFTVVIEMSQEMHKRKDDEWDCFPPAGAYEKIQNHLSSSLGLAMTDMGTTDVMNQLVKETYQKNIPESISCIHIVQKQQFFTSTVKERC